MQDERVALDHGVLGQETTGPGGIAYGLRTVPVARWIAERVRAVAPDAWVINFTNPAGMITEAMRGILGDRVVGICDTPITMAKRAARLLGVDPHAAVDLDYVGLNHLGWLRGLRVDGERPAAPAARRRRPARRRPRRASCSGWTGSGRSARCPTSTSTTTTSPATRSRRSGPAA